MHTSTILFGLDRLDKVLQTVESRIRIQDLAPYICAACNKDTDVVLLYKSIKDTIPKEDSDLGYYMRLPELFAILLYWAELNAPDQVKPLLEQETNIRVLETIRTKIKFIDNIFKTNLASKIKARRDALSQYLKSAKVIYFGNAKRFARASKTMINFAMIRSVKELQNKLEKLEKLSEVDLFIGDKGFGVGSENKCQAIITMPCTKEVLKDFGLTHEELESFDSYLDLTIDFEFEISFKKINGGNNENGGNGVTIKFSKLDFSIELEKFEDKINKVISNTLTKKVIKIKAKKVNRANFTYEMDEAIEGYISEKEG